MVERSEMENFIRRLLRGHKSSFEECSLIMMACSYKRVIPASFWTDEEQGGYGILGLKNLSWSEMQTVRDEVINRIIDEINDPTPEYTQKMHADNYSRLFHALSILRVRKKDSRVRISAEGEVSPYAVAYNLWLLDNGSEEKYQHISRVAWTVAELEN